MRCCGFHRLSPSKDQYVNQEITRSAKEDEGFKDLSQQRDLFRVIKTHDSNLFLESLLPLEKVLFKHHEKEEENFSPMASFVLLFQRDEIMRR